MGSADDEPEPGGRPLHRQCRHDHSATPTYGRPHSSLATVLPYPHRAPTPVPANVPRAYTPVPANLPRAHTPVPANLPRAHTPVPANLPRAHTPVLTNVLRIPTSSPSDGPRSRFHSRSPPPTDPLPRRSSPTIPTPLLRRRPHAPNLPAPCTTLNTERTNTTSKFRKPTPNPCERPIRTDTPPKPEPNPHERHPQPALNQPHHLRQRPKAAAKGNTGSHPPALPHPMGTPRQAPPPTTTSHDHTATNTPLRHPHGHPACFLAVTLPHVRPSGLSSA
ncbi:hypothetical protein GCM10029964_029700 [Kibdelosporangium lantanae]